MPTITETSENKKTKLLKKYHTLLRMQGVDNEAKMAMLAGYGVKSSKDLTIAQLVDIIVKLEGGGTEQKSKNVLDIYRKRVFAAAYAWLNLLDNPNVGNADYVKSICCRKLGYKDFNKIPQQQLINLYNGFIKSKKDMLAVEEMAMEILTQKQ